MDTTPRPGHLEEVPVEQCPGLMASASVCRVGFVLDEQQYVLPVAFVLLDGRVCFKSSAGSKLGLASGGGAMIAQADGVDVETHTGWSVLARGVASIVVDPDELSALTDLPFEPWVLPADEGMWVRIDVDEWSGRRIIRRT